MSAKILSYVYPCVLDKIHGLVIESKHRSSQLPFHFFHNAHIFTLKVMLDAQNYFCFEIFMVYRISFPAFRNFVALSFYVFLWLVRGYVYPRTMLEQRKLLSFVLLRSSSNVFRKTLTSG